MNTASNLLINILKATDGNIDINTGIEEIDQFAETVQDKDKMKEYLEMAGDWIVKKGITLLLTLLFVFIGVKLIKLLMNVINKSFEKSGLTKGVDSFLCSLIKVVLYSVLLITAATILGFQVTSFIAILGSAGVAVGLALQGSLSNLAGGVLILIIKPFVVGDYIIENDKGCEGTVTSIEIFYTKLVTPDNKVIVIPNGNLTSHSLVNVTAEKMRRLDVTIGVSYDSDIKKVKDVLTSIANSCEERIATKETNVFVDSFGDSQITMGLRFWVPTDKYWPVKWAVNEKIKYEFDKAGIVIPFNQIDVEIKNGGKN